MDTFEIGGTSYRAGRIDAIKQLHVVRRLSPLVGALQGPDLDAITMAPPPPGEDAANSPEVRQRDDALAGLLSRLTGAVASLSDADTEYVLAVCLGVVERQEANGLGWSRVWNQAARRPQYDDINLVTMMQLVGRVLMANVGDFTSALPRSFQSASALAPK